MHTDDAIREVAEQFYVAVNQLQHGDAAPMLIMWSHALDVTHMGPGGDRQQGWPHIQAYYEHAATVTAQSPGQVTATMQDLVVRLHAELAYTCATEHVQVTHADGVTSLLTRATHIYRHESGGWKLIHRHADTVSAL